MKKELGKLLTILMMFFSMSLSCFAAPSVDYAGRITDSALPYGFTDGYLYANHDTYNSHEAENGLEGTYIWFEGTFNSFDKIQLDEGNAFVSFVTDLDGKQWAVVMDSEQYCSEAFLTELYNVPLAFTARYGGFSDNYNMPIAFTTKLCNISTGKISVSALTNARYDNIPLSTGISTSQKEKTIGRYYYSPDYKTYDSSTYIQIIDVRDTSIAYSIIIKGVNCSTDFAYRQPGIGDGTGVNAYKSKVDDCYFGISGPVIILTATDSVSNKKSFIKVD